jgi:hypothetical protein
MILFHISDISLPFIFFFCGKPSLSSFYFIFEQKMERKKMKSNPLRKLDFRKKNLLYYHFLTSICVAVTSVVASDVVVSAATTFASDVVQFIWQDCLRARPV